MQTNSDLEYEVALSLEYDYLVSSYEYEPYRDHPQLPNIDFTVERDSNSYWVECKYFNDLKKSEVQKQIFKQLDYAKTASIKHLLITERNLVTKVGLSNMRMIIQWSVLSQLSVQLSSIQIGILKLLPCNIMQFSSLGEPCDIQAALSGLLLSGRAEVDLESGPLKTHTCIASPSVMSAQGPINIDWCKNE